MARMRIESYIRLARLDRPIGIWLLLLPGWWSILPAAGGLLRMNAGDWKIFILFGLGAVLMRSAGCVINDIWDRDLDTRVARTRQRPIAAGEIGIAPALIFLFVLLACSFLILLEMNLVTILLGFLSLPLIAAYPLMKRWTWWPQAFLGLTFNFGALMGWSAVTGILETPAVLLYAGGIFWTLGYDTIYAHQDKEDDALAGIKSSALRLGAHSKRWVALFYAAAFLFISTSMLLTAPAPATVPCLMPALYCAWRILRKWEPHDRASSLQAFKANRDLALLLLAGIAAAMTAYSP